MRIRVEVTGPGRHIGGQTGPRATFDIRLDDEGDPVEAEISDVVAAAENATRGLLKAVGVAPAPAGEVVSESRTNIAEVPLASEHSTGSRAADWHGGGRANIEAARNAAGIRAKDHGAQ